MKYKILILVIIILMVLLFIFRGRETVNDEEIVKTEITKPASVKHDVKTNKKEKYEPIPIIENSGMLFETYEEAEQWVKAKNISEFEIMKCEWKWENGYKTHGINGLEYYTVKIIE